MPRLRSGPRSLPAPRWLSAVLRPSELRAAVLVFSCAQGRRCRLFCGVAGAPFRGERYDPLGRPVRGREGGGVMKAAVLREVGRPLQIEDVQIDKPGPREVLIRTAAAGV